MIAAAETATGGAPEPVAREIHKRSEGAVAIYFVAFDTDPDGLKRTIFERLKDAGEKATPVVVDRELAKIERIYGEWMPPLAYCLFNWHLRRSQVCSAKYFCTRAAVAELKRALDESS